MCVVFQTVAKNKNNTFIFFNVNVGLLDTFLQFGGKLIWAMQISTFDHCLPYLHIFNTKKKKKSCFIPSSV